MVDLACSGAHIAKAQQVLSGRSIELYNKFEVGYVFGCLDVYKTFVWGVTDFNRSFFHCGFLSFFGSMELANEAMVSLGVFLVEEDQGFLKGATVGKKDAIAFVNDGTHPSGLFLNTADQE